MFIQFDLLKVENLLLIFAFLNLNFNTIENLYTKISIIAISCKLVYYLIAQKTKNMKFKKRTSWSLFLATLSVGFLQAQQSALTSIGNVSGVGGTVSYSVGQIFYTPASGMGGSVAQGLQQPFEISVVLDLEEAKGITLQCTVYPNPTSGNVTLQIENYDIQNLSYTILDLNGRIIVNNKISSKQTFISMENLASATFYINIMKHSEKLKVFKIIKKL
jgi:hypothetical protein